jgi:hypothetical protein
VSADPSLGLTRSVVVEPARGIVLRARFAYVADVTGGRWSRARFAHLGGRLLALAASLLVWCHTRETRAQEAGAPVESFRLVWSSSAECGNGRTFLEELESRTARLREAREGEHAITLIVETFRTAGGVRGQLTVRKPDGDLTVREVPGLNCAEVESGMALIAALMVDPLAGNAQQTRPHPLRALPARAAESTRAPATPPTSDWSLRIEPRLTIRTAVAPGWTWGEALGAMLTRQTSRFRPSAALSVHDARATVTKRQGSAELEWTAAELELCPFGARPGAAWDLRACASFQLGRLRGVGFQTVRPAEKSILWTSAGLSLAGRYQLVGPLWIGLEGAFTFPFSRERFYLEPELTLHQVPAWGVSFGLGLGLRFF